MSMIFDGIFGKRSWDDIQVVMFVSTGRTGTNFIYKFYEEFGLNVLSEHEPKPDISEIGPGYAKGSFTKDQVLKEIERMRRSQFSTLKARRIPIYLESNGGYSFIFHLLREVFKNLTVVHIIREPVSWIKSAFNRPHIDSTGKVVPKYSIDSKWKLTSNDVAGQNDILNWEVATLRQKLAWTWYYKNATIINNSKLVNNFLTVRFEDLFSPETSVAQFNALNEFLGKSAGLKLKEGDFSGSLLIKRNESTNFIAEHEETWDANEIQSIDRIVGPIRSIFYQGSANRL